MTTHQNELNRVMQVACLCNDNANPSEPSLIRALVEIGYNINTPSPLLRVEPNDMDSTYPDSYTTATQFYNTPKTSLSLHRAFIDQDPEALELTLSRINAHYEWNLFNFCCLYRESNESLISLTPLSYAALLGNDIAVRELLLNGADKTMRDCAGFTARDIAIVMGFESVVLLLDDPIYEKM